MVQYNVQASCTTMQFVLQHLTMYKTTIAFLSILDGTAGHCVPTSPLTTAIHFKLLQYGAIHCTTMQCVLQHLTRQKTTIAFLSALDGTAGHSVPTSPLTTAIHFKNTVMYFILMQCGAMYCTP